MALSKIIVISHSHLFSQTIATLIEKTIAISSISSCIPQKALPKLREEKPNTVIIDIPLTDFSALNLLHKIYKQYRQIKIIVITDNLAPAFLTQLFKIKIAACLSKYCSSVDLKTALNHVEEKKIFCDQKISTLIQTIHDRKFAKIKSLTRQEFQIVVMLAHGIKTQEISRQLHLSIKTISSYHTQILNKLNLQHNIEIVQFIHQHQLLLLPMNCFAFLS